MVIETSALAAILFKEPEREGFIDLILADKVRLLSAVSALELSIVVESKASSAGVRDLDLFLQKAQIAIVPFTADHWEEARSAWRIYGKGRHPAGLNFCDCCSYALAKTSREPLLFKGSDFSQTDIAAATL